MPFSRNRKSYLFSPKSNVHHPGGQDDHPKVSLPCLIVLPIELPIVLPIALPIALPIVLPIALPIELLFAFSTSFTFAFTILLFI